MGYRMTMRLSHDTRYPIINSALFDLSTATTFTADLAVVIGVPCGVNATLAAAVVALHFSRQSYHPLDLVADVSKKIVRGY